MEYFTPLEIRTRLAAAFAGVSRNELSAPGFHKSAVLVPLMLLQETSDLLLTKRTDTVETHKGQIAFPGGMVDNDDRDIVHTALRETEEELGIPAGKIETVGILDDLSTPSGYIISPVVGILDRLPILHLNPREVDVAFPVPLRFFADAGNGRCEMREVLGEKRELWFYEYGTHMIWGATAMIIRALLKRIGMLQ